MGSMLMFVFAPHVILVNLFPYIYGVWPTHKYTAAGGSDVMSTSLFIEIISLSSPLIPIKQQNIQTQKWVNIRVITKMLYDE